MMLAAVCSIAAIGGMGPQAGAASDIPHVDAASQPASVMDVTAFGAVGDGVTLNTAAIQKAIDACSAGGGGKLAFPAGRYLTGTIQLKNNVIMHLDDRAILLGSTNAADYRNVDPFVAGDGVPLGHGLIVAVDADHVGIEGSGVIDGQGKAVAAAQAKYTVRPFLTRWIRCGNVTMRGVTMRDPGAWTNHFFQCHDVHFNNITVRSRGSGLRNNDGVDIDSCQSVDISDCDIESGDDAICLKTTSEQACRDVTVTGCKLGTQCNSIKLGTESLGDFEHITISHCDIHNVGMAGIALYGVDGAHLHDVTISDITMDGVAVPISIRLGARLKTFRVGQHAKPAGTISDVTLRNIHAIGVRLIGLLINGIADHPVESLTLENIHIDLPGGGKEKDALAKLPEKEAAYPEMSMFGRTLPAYGVYLRHARGVVCRDVELTPTQPDARPAAVLVDVEGVKESDFIAPPK